MTDNLPARIEPTYGDAGPPLAQAPTVALGFALGYAAARPQSADQFGPFCALVETLGSRRVPGSHPDDNETEWTQLLAVLPTALARQIGMLYTAQRGQRWAHTGRRS